MAWRKVSGNLCHNIVWTWSSWRDYSWALSPFGLLFPSNKNVKRKLLSNFREDIQTHNQYYMRVWDCFPYKTRFVFLCVSLIFKRTRIWEDVKKITFQSMNIVKVWGTNSMCTGQSKKKYITRYILARVWSFIFLVAETLWLLLLQGESKVSFYFVGFTGGGQGKVTKCKERWNKKMLFCWNQCQNSKYLI